MNKAQLIDALAERLGDRKVAAAAVAALLDVVIRTVHGGERVTITGFGVFEKRARAARTARNPRTGQVVAVRQTDVPAFRPGTLFREVVSGTRVLPDAGGATRAANRPATRVTATTHLAPAADGTPTKTAKPPKETKAAKATKLTKAAKSAKVQSKNKGNGQSSAKAAKKAGKKSVGKK